MRRMDDIRRVPRAHYNHFHGLNKQEEPIAETEKKNIAEAAIRIQESYRVEHVQPKKKLSFFKKSYILVAFTIVVMIFGGYFGARFISFANSISTSEEPALQILANNIGAAFGPLIPALKGLDQTDLAKSIEEGKRINILMLGYGGSGHDGAFLTDSMMLVSIDSANKKASYIPIPRDLWVKIPTRGYDGSYAKINSAYSTGLDFKNFPDKLPQFTGVDGGGNMAKYEASQVLGLPVDYYVAVDFYAFKRVVDALGGVEVDVENTFTDYTYPSGDANVDGPFCVADDRTAAASSCRYKKVHFEKGLQYMDGTKALEYARSRHAVGPEGSDFARSRRQQRLISAIQDKAMSIGAVTKIFSLMDGVQGHFRTDLSIAEIKDLADLTAQVDLNGAEQISLTDGKLLTSTYSLDGQWILLPAKAGSNNESGIWDDVHKYVKENLK